MVLGEISEYALSGVPFKKSRVEIAEMLKGRKQFSLFDKEVENLGEF